MKKTSLAPLALLLCALPLSAGSTGRHVVAACELTTATVIPSGRESDTQGREFAIRVTNGSTRTVAVPRSPGFGWRVESLDRRDWRLTGEGGPVRRISSSDPHIVVSGEPENLPLVEIPPGKGETFFVYLPEAQQALQSDRQFSHYKLTLYWAPGKELAKSNPSVLPCGLMAQWVVDVQKLPPPK